MTKFTPGPWKIHQYSTTAGYANKTIVRSADRDICRLDVVLVSKAQVMSGGQYHQWLFNLMLLILGIFYQFGYTDGSKTAISGAFDDFVSSLDIDN